MDPSYPSKYWKNGRPKIVHSGLKAGEAQSNDKRFAAYFEYNSAIRMYADRGTVFYSNYRFKRYDNIRKTGKGQLIDFSVYENRLYAIEAWTRTDQKALAISTLNNVDYPRIYNGKLDALPDDIEQKDLLNIIFYEREIDLLGQGYLIGFCDMRRRDMLSKGTILHFPVPGNELQTLLMDNYTFGGVENADGTNTSNGGWE